MFDMNFLGLKRAFDFKGRSSRTREAGWRFCIYCGSPVNPSAVFCSKCGERIQDRQQFTQSSASEENTMDRQKMVQIFKEIFDQYGVEIMREQSRFQSVVLDFLSAKEYKEEKIVFRNAIESGALLPFAVPTSVTDETVKAVLSELQQRGHLTEEDAKFVAQCILAACGSNVTVK